MLKYPNGAKIIITQKNSSSIKKVWDVSQKSVLEEPDTIVLLNGNEIKAKVFESTIDLIKYKKFDNINGPIYIIKKSEVLMLKHQNGEKNIINKASSNTLINEKNQIQNVELEKPDTIIQINGNKINSKVIEETTDVINYKKFENINGPIYTINKSEVFMLKYPNGEIKIISKNNSNSLKIDNIPSQKTVTEKPDTLILISGDEIYAKILEITEVEIKYKNYDNINGTTSAIKKSEVFMIIYQNGEMKTISQKKSNPIKNDITQLQNVDPEKPDSIILVTGDEINAKILEVTAKAIKYKKFENITGPTYSLKKSEVFMLKYPNGETKIISEKKSNTLKNENIQSQKVTSEKPDIIVLLNGDEISAKVLEETTDDIKYKKFDNITGPIFTINKSEVFLLKYSIPPVDKKKRK